jgi:transglutaminase-like putative cysteine protease
MSDADAATVRATDHDDPSLYLNPTWFVDSDSQAIVDFAQRAVADATDPIDRACRLYYAVRDEIRYTAYGLKLEREHFRASAVLEAGHGWCVTKGCLLAATARAAGLPCRMGYADVRNHLATEKLLKWIGTDIFYFHGYNEFWLEGRWVKATVAFNQSLCEKAGLLPLEFDGVHDSIYHPFDQQGRRHMEYLHERGTRGDIPYDEILTTFATYYPHMGQANSDQATPQGDFEAEIAAENVQRCGD